MISANNGIKKFSGQGLEKNNAESKAYLRSSNRHNAPEIMLRTKQRQHKLHAETTSTGDSVVRRKRSYSQRDSSE